MFLGHFWRPLRRCLACPSLWQQLPPGAGLSRSVTLLLGHTMLPVLLHPAFHHLLSAGKPSDPPLPVHALEWLLFAWLQRWVYDLDLANQSSPSPTSSDWFKDNQGGPSRGQEVPWHFTGHAGREVSILSTGHELLAATLPLRGVSLWNHLGKSRAKRRRTWTSLRPLGQPYNWNQPMPDLFGSINECILFFSLP